MESLAQVGLTILDAKDEIFSLVVGDYYKGPEQDLDLSKPGDVWVFKKNVEGNLFYIKVKIAQVDGEDFVKCLSFHKDEFA